MPMMGTNLNLSLHQSKCHIYCLFQYLFSRVLLLLSDNKLNKCLCFALNFLRIILQVGGPADSGEREEATANYIGKDYGI